MSAMLSHLDTEGLWAIVAFSVFFATPILLNAILTIQEKSRRKINKMLLPHGLRLKQK
jgi:hypothetical protein